MMDETINNKPMLDEPTLDEPTLDEPTLDKPMLDEPIADAPIVDEQRQSLYIQLIEQLLQCPNGQEPEVLDAHLDLVDTGLVQVMMRVATYYAHHDNPDGAKFLIYVARELARQLGLYPLAIPVPGETP